MKNDYYVQIHKSGAKSIVDKRSHLELSSSATGKVDEIVKVVKIGKANKKEVEKMMEKPHEFNVDKYGVADVTDRWKKRWNNRATPLRK